MPSLPSLRERYLWVVPLLATLLLMYGEVFWSFAQTVWATDEQSHGPIVLAVSAWLFWRKRDELLALQSPGNRLAGGLLLAFGVLIYVAGRNQMYDTLEALSLVFVLAGGLVVLRGWPGLRLMLFPVLFLCFMVPLPGILVQTVTTPVKIAVSYVAESLLALFGLPVARSGVILFVGPYQLLVADACSGLNSLFTLESLGLLYMNLMGYKSITRNVLLAILIVPISFIANVCRVMILILVTYYMGDAAGQGFLHSLAGMTLFLIALVLMLAVDHLLGLALGRGAAKRGAAAGPGASAAVAVASAAGNTLMPRSLAIAAVVALATVLGHLAVPRLVSGDGAQAKLDSVIPTSFGDWRIDPTIVPVSPSPDQAALIGEIYDQTLARTYVNNSGERVMLSLAYGRNQSRRFQIHKPEICYVGQGFRLDYSAMSTMPVADNGVPVMQLVAVQGQRVEPITYWIRVGDGLGRGWVEQNRIRARYALRGQIPDGLLFRVSTIARGTQPQADFDLHKRFVNDLVASMQPAQVAAVLGDVAHLKSARAAL